MSINKLQNLITIYFMRTVSKQLNNKIFSAKNNPDTKK